MKFSMDSNLIKKGHVLSMSFEYIILLYFYLSLLFELAEDFDVEEDFDFEPEEEDLAAEPEDELLLLDTVAPDL